MPVPTKSKIDPGWFAPFMLWTELADGRYLTVEAQLFDEARLALWKPGSMCADRKRIDVMGNIIEEYWSVLKGISQVVPG